MTLNAEAGGGADEVRAFDWTIEFKLPKVQEEALAVAKAAATTDASDTSNSLWWIGKAFSRTVAGMMWMPLLHTCQRALVIANNLWSMTQ